MMTQKSPTSSLRAFCRFARANHLDIICLQEIGRKTDTIQDHPLNLFGYCLYLCCSGKNIHESVGFLIRDVFRPRVTRYDKITPGRLAGIKLNLDCTEFNIFTVYYPPGLESTSLKKKQPQQN